MSRSACLATAAFALMLGLGGCVPEAERAQDGPLPIAALMMPAEAATGVSAVEEKSVLVDRGPEFDTDVVPITIQILRSARVTSTAEYLYRHAAAEGGVINVKLFAHADEAAGIEGWSARFKSGGSWQPWVAGDAGAMRSGRMRAFRVGPLLVQISARLDDAQLEAFARSYAGFVLRQLQGPPASGWRALVERLRALLFD